MGAHRWVPVPKDFREPDRLPLWVCLWCRDIRQDPDDAPEECPEHVD